jgi:23S rRNA (cytosine1962-C5)-methyltransferase
VGGWSLQAALGGARSVLGIDSSEEALTRARRNAELNGVAERVSFEQEDVFESFRRMVAEGRQFDLVIVDPPAFAKRRTQKKTAVSGYREINIQAMKLTRPGGVLATCSCSHHVSADDFRNILVQAARGARRTLRLIEQRGAAMDHPVLLSMRETEYLKCLLLQVTR